MVFVRRLVWIAADEAERRNAKSDLEGRGREVLAFDDFSAALATKLDDVDLIVCEVVIGTVVLNEYVASFRERAPLAPIVAIAGDASPSLCYELGRLRVAGLLETPLEIDDGLMRAFEHAARTHLGAPAEGVIDLKRLARAARDRAVDRALESAGGNITVAAGWLGLTRQGLQRRLRRRAG